MDKSDWRAVEIGLHSMLPCYLDCDGYLLTIHPGLHRSRMKYLLFIDRWQKPEWRKTDCEIRRRFFQHRKVDVFKPKQKAALLACAKTKAGKKEMRDQASLKFEIWQDVWGSLEQLKKHLIANNKEIRLIRDYGEIERRLEELRAKEKKEEAAANG